MNRPYIVLPITLLVTALGAAGQTLMKGAVNGAPRGAEPLTLIASVLASGRFWAGIIVTGIGTIAWLLVLARADLSYATPFASVSTALLILVASVVFLQEPVGWMRVVGTLIVAIGVIFVARS
jgi:drug/metabolite transporter (DMT)-like permease